MKLSKTNRLRHRKLLSSLRRAEQRLRMGVMGANNDLRRTMKELAELVRMYNYEREKTAAFVREICSDVEDLMEERSERWHDSDAGQALSMFIDEWSDALAELEGTVDPPVLPEFELETDLESAILFDRLHMETE